MENNKKGKLSSKSSITSQLFGSQESSSSNDVFASIFPPKVVGRHSEVRGPWQKEPSGSGNLDTKKDYSYKHGEENKDKNSKFQQEGMEACCLSSSIHYGSREMYTRTPSHSTPTHYPTFKKDGEDDSSDTGRGNWWKGSLYY